MRADTIFAPATAPGLGGVAILRVSGPQARATVERLTGKALPPPRRAAVRRLFDPQSGEAIDRGLVLWFPAPDSMTGEDVAEFHVHGGRAVLQAMSEALASIAGCRLAEPGEFTRRAFENGKMDLTEAEAVADLVAAQTAAQRRQALRQLDGALGALYEGWRARLVRALAHVEADIDFPDEDLPHGIAAAVRPDLDALIEEMTAHLDDNRRGERLREGIHIAIVGAPNVGKSSLLNLLAQRDVAIVAETAGTTRDVIEVSLDLGGWPVTLADTAGLRDSNDAIEREGVRRAIKRAEHADLRLGVLDAGNPDSLAALLDVLRPGDLIVLNKADLLADRPRPAWPPDAALWLSARHGSGTEDLLRAIEQCVAQLLQSSAVSPTRHRHRQAVMECREFLRQAHLKPEIEFVAENLRMSVREIGHITGRICLEDILDAVFREFCIGK